MICYIDFHLPEFLHIASSDRSRLLEFYWQYGPDWSLLSSTSTPPPPCCINPPLKVCVEVWPWSIAPLLCVGPPVVFILPIKFVLSMALIDCSSPPLWSCVPPPHCIYPPIESVLTVWHSPPHRSLCCIYPPHWFFGLYISCPILCVQDTESKTTSVCYQIIVSFHMN